MKVFIPAVVSLLAWAVVARPRPMEEGDTLPETSRVTAFVVSEDGTPSVECWEFTNMVNEMQVQQRGGSKGTAYSMSLATARELDGLDILTWPSYSPLWPPPPDAVQAEWLDLSSFNSLFSVQRGLIQIARQLQFDSNVDDDEPSNYIFSLENGDDWFYFEDSYTGSSLARSADAAPPPIQISTISGSETEVLRLRFPQQPQYKVLHKGACSFTGLKTSGSSGKGRTSRVHRPLASQQYCKNGL